MYRTEQNKVPTIYTAHDAMRCDKELTDCPR